MQTKKMLYGITVVSIFSFLFFAINQDENNSNFQANSEKLKPANLNVKVEIEEAVTQVIQNQDPIISNKTFESNAEPSLNDQPGEIPDALLMKETEVEEVVQVEVAPRLSIKDIISKDANWLRELVINGQDLNEVQAAVWAMANRMELNDEDVDVLLQRLDETTEKDMHLRKTILWSLSLRPDRIPVDKLSEIAKNDVMPEVRRTAVRTLSLAKNEDNESLIEYVALNDSDAQTRGESVFFLTLKSERTDVVEFAQRAMSTETDDEVRRRWVGYVGNKKAEGTSIFLDKILYKKSESMIVRKTAAEMLVSNGDREALDILSDPTVSKEIKNHIQLLFVEDQVTDSGAPSSL